MRYKIAAALGAVSILSTGLCPAIAGPLEDAQAARHNGDYAKALRGLRALADEGNAQAQYELGRMYDAGQGVERDYSLAASWTGKAAAQGNDKAQFLLALMYARGQGVARSDVRGRYWLAKAEAGDLAHRDNLRAIYAANLAAADPNPERQAKRAFANVRTLAAQGNAEAQLKVGEMLMEGRGIGRDYREAALWLRKAAIQGLAPAQSALGGLYELGLGVKQDYGEARAWFLKAANQGYAPAQVNLADLYEYGYGVAKDQAQFEYWRAKAAENPAPSSSLPSPEPPP